MDYIKISGLEKSISKLILGTAWMTLENKETADQVLYNYIKSGGNLIDTGRFYMGGKSELYLKNWIKENSELASKLMFTSKACHHYVNESNIHFPEKSRVNPECITEDLEYSLSNLGLDKFDIYMLHRDDLDFPVEPLMDCLEKHHKEGRITTYGVSNWSIDRIKKAQDYCKQKGYQGICVNSPSYSLATVKKPRWFGTVYATDEYAKWNTENDITILSWGSQGNGFFGNNPFEGEVTQDYKDAFYTDENYEKLRRAKELAIEKGRDIESVNIALAYILSQDLKIAAIIGPRNIEELNSTTKVENVFLNSEDIEYLSLRNNNH